MGDGYYYLMFEKEELPLVLPIQSERIESLNRVHKRKVNKVLHHSLICCAFHIFNSQAQKDRNSKSYLKSYAITRWGERRSSDESLSTLNTRLVLSHRIPPRATGVPIRSMWFWCWWMPNLEMRTTKNKLRAMTIPGSGIPGSIQED
jgi:hypothetical protein